MVHVHRVAEKDFEGTRLKHHGRWVVLFQGPWCGFCAAFRPVFEHTTPPHGVTLAEYVMDDFYEPVPLAFDVEVIPTVVAFQDGAVAWRHSGIANRGLGEPTIHKIEKWT